MGVEMMEVGKKYRTRNKFIVECYDTGNTLAWVRSKEHGWSYPVSNATGKHNTQGKFDIVKEVKDEPTS